MRSQIVNSRSRSLLVFILAVQVASFAANACALGVTISASHNPTALRTIQTACTVLALTGSMSAYLRTSFPLFFFLLNLILSPPLVHTYNLHLRNTPPSTNSNYNNLSAHSPDMIESQRHHSNSHSPKLIQLAPPPLPKVGHNRKNPIEKNLETNAKATDSLELDVVVDIGNYSMTLGCLGGPSSTPRSGKEDSIDVGLRLVSSPACTPVPAALPVPLPLRVSVEDSEGSGFSTLEKRKKEKIQEYYLSSSSSPSTASPSSPFERCGTETDPSSPDTPYPDVARNEGAISANTNIIGNTQIRKRSSFFGWEFAWDQEALERADDAGKLRSVVGGSPVRWKSDLNPVAFTKIQPLLMVDQEENFTDLGGDRESLDPSKPRSLSSEAEVGGGMKRGMSWRSSVCGVVGGEKLKRKNTLGLGIGIKPLRLSRSFGGTSNNSGGGGSRGSVATGTGNGREMGHRMILSEDAGPMCGLSLKRKATTLIGGQRSPASPSRVMGRQGNGDATRTITMAIPTPKRLKKTKSRHSNGAAGTSPSAESERNSENNDSIGFIHGDNRNSDSSNDELDEDVDADDLQKTPTMKWRTTIGSYSHPPQSYRYSTRSSPNQQRHEAATSGSHCSSVNESCITTTNTNSPQKSSPSLTKRGLSLKRSFKMGSTVGRTLGPGLTLSGAELSSGSDSNFGPLPTSNSPIRRYESEGFGPREEEEGEKKGKKVGKEDDEDVDVEVEVENQMRSLGAARPVPDSYVRAMATATILTPATGTNINVDISGGSSGFASRSGGGNGPVKYTTMSTKSMLHSLPTMNPTTTVSSPPVCSTITEQYQQQKQDGHNSVFSAGARKPNPFIDWFRSLETSTSRGVADVEQEMEIIRRSGRGNDNERLISSLPILPPLPPLLPSVTLPSQSQSLPPTPTKSQSTLLGKPSMSSFKKRSVPPALPPLPGSSEWAHSMLTTNGMSGAAVSMVSLTHSRTRSVSRASTQPPSRPTTPKPSMRLSAMNMGTVRNAFAGVGAKVSARMSINSASTRSSAGAAASSNTVASSVGMGVGIGIGMDDIDGDFMNLRDPFASPPPSKLVGVFRGGDHTAGVGSDFWVSERAMSSLGGGAGVAKYDDDDSVEVGITRRLSSINGGKRRLNMNAWGRLPIPSATLPLPGTVPEASNGGDSSVVASNIKKAHSHHGERRKHKKERRARKVAATPGVLVVEANSSLHGYSAPCSAGEEDADFGVEEALLSQRLLRRLDSVEWD